MKPHRHRILKLTLVIMVVAIIILLVLTVNGIKVGFPIKYSKDYRECIGITRATRDPTGFIVEECYGVSPFPERANIDPLAMRNMLLKDYPPEEAAKMVINANIEGKNYCREDYECTSVTFGCPFGCYSLVNKRADVTYINDAIIYYRNNYGLCLYECVRNQNPDEIKCVDGKCVDTRL